LAPYATLIAAGKEIWFDARAGFTVLTAPPELARSALEAAPDAMMMIDSSGIIRFTNRQASSLFQYSHDEIVGRNIEELMPERFRARHIAHRSSYFNNLRLRPMGLGLDLYGRRQDGSEFPWKRS